MAPRRLAPELLMLAVMTDLMSFGFLLVLMALSIGFVAACERLK